MGGWRGLHRGGGGESCDDQRRDSTRANQSVGSLHAGSFSRAWRGESVKQVRISSPTWKSRRNAGIGGEFVATSRKPLTAARCMSPADAQGAPAASELCGARMCGPLFRGGRKPGQFRDKCGTQIRRCRWPHRVVDADKPANASLPQRARAPGTAASSSAEADKSGRGSRLTAVAAPACRLGWARGPADLRDRERVRRHVHVQGAAPALARRGRPLPVPQGGLAGAAAATSSSRNGARLYLDVGSHPEYATPECDDIVDLVTHDKAGERVLEGLLVDAERRLHDEGIAGDVYLFKNNTDSRRQLLRLPRELPGQPARRVQHARRRADPVPGDPADHLRRRQGDPDPARGVVLREPARRAHLGGRLQRHHPVAADHQHPRRAARRRRALPPAARDRRRLEHERDDHACSRSPPATSCCG